MALLTDFEPALTLLTSDPNVVLSSQSGRVNTLYRSKIEQPDAVPFLNFDPVGSEESPILRILKLRDSLIILKEEGVWKLTGETETDFVTKELDPSVKVLAPDAAVVLNNSVYCMSNQGVVKINESGTAIMSRPIEDELDRIQVLPNFSLSFAISYEQEKRYILATPETASDTFPKLLWVWNYITKAWTRWKKNVNAGIVLFDTDELFLGHAEDTFVLKERKALSSEDYIDETLTNFTVISSDTTVDEDGNTVSRSVIVYTYANATLSPGWLFEHNSQEAIITEVEFISGQSFRVTLDRLISFVGTSAGGFWGLLGLIGHFGGLPGVGGGAGTADLSISIPSKVHWASESAQQPQLLKQYSFAQIAMEDNDAKKHDLSFFSDYVSTQEKVANITTGNGANSTAVRTAIPKNYQKCRFLDVIYEHSRAKERFRILHLALSTRMISDKTTRIA
jgi:hypothetical protein